MSADPSKASPAAPCPCGRPAAYLQCCGRYHAGPLHLQAPDAESLMRSRYSAFVLGLMPYLVDTWHPETRPAILEPYDPATQWLGLQVKRAETHGDTAAVEFVARFKLAGRATRVHELSRFVRADGHWLYVDGDLR